MLSYPSIDPIAFSLGPLHVHWYGLMYLIGFLGAWILGVYRARRPNSPLTTEQVGDFIFYGALGVIIGGRLGYMVFYDFSNFVTHPWRLFELWKGGMSFHGGLIGVIVAIFLFSRRYALSFFTVGDFFVPMIPIGLGAGRLGNFINDELWGRVTTMPWGMVFPSGGPWPRHPSQLYEFFLEGLVLFVVLWWFSNKPRPRMANSGLFLLAYGLMRFFVEFFREPDSQIGFVALGWMTEGQLLCLPMILIGSVWLWRALSKHSR